MSVGVRYGLRLRKVADLQRGAREAVDDEAEAVIDVGVEDLRQQRVADQRVRHQLASIFDLPDLCAAVQQ